MEAIATRKRTLAIIDKYELTAHKSLGQNFIINENIIRNIIEISDLKKTNYILEIGPGIGALTWELALLKKQLLAVEIDRDLIKPLENEVLKYFDNIKLINADILKVNILDIFSKTFPEFKKTDEIVVVANLPYYITSQIITHLLKSDIIISKMILMTQREAAQRLLIGAKNKKYNYLNVVLQLYYDFKIMIDVSKTNFLPEPKVESSVVEFVLHNKFLKIDKHQMMAFLKICFSQKRKTLVNNLKIKYSSQKIITILNNLNWSESIRAEELKVEDFIILFKEVNNFDDAQLS